MSSHLIHCAQFLGCDFNFPKLHSLPHYLEMIHMLGTTDNYNTEATERLHIDLAKDAYRATNKKDYYDQMVLWLERREKIWAFDVVLQWRQGIMPKPRSRYLRRHRPGALLARTPGYPNTPLLKIVQHWGATAFTSELQKFIRHYLRANTIGNQHSRTSEPLLISNVDVWPLVKFSDHSGNVAAGTSLDALHIAYAVPQRKSAKGRAPARFDTVLVDEELAGSHSDSRGVSAAMQGEYASHIATL